MKRRWACVGLLAMTAPGAAPARAQQMQTQPSLAEAARQAKQRRAARPSGTIFTNENLPTDHGVSVVGPEDLQEIQLCVVSEDCLRQSWRQMEQAAN